MNNQEPHSDLLTRLDSVDAVSTEPVPAGWSRRSWVQREAIAFGALTLESPTSIKGDEL